MINQADRRAVVEEVRLAIVEALREGDIVKTDVIAKVVARSYPNNGFREDQIEQHLCKKATMAGVRIGSTKLSVARDQRRLIQRDAGAG